MTDYRPPRFDHQGHALTPGVKVRHKITSEHDQQLWGDWYAYVLPPTRWILPDFVYLLTHNGMKIRLPKSVLEIRDDLPDWVESITISDVPPPEEWTDD